MTETEIWAKWESQVVNGIFPLRRFLGRSNHSVVFLTECRAQNLAQAAIKIIPADPARSESQLSRWQSAAALSHPHLTRLLEAGRCKLGGHPFLFVVTEYADQNLAQLLPHRALTVEEGREMLVPALDALTFLHGQNLVQGKLKASNFLVVNDRLKLASDTIRASRDTVGIDLAEDMRALGATAVEALTQTRPALNGPAFSLPPTLSAGLADALRRCLSPDPRNRPTAAQLQDQIDPAIETVAPAATEPQSPATQPPAPGEPIPAASPEHAVPEPEMAALELPLSQAPAPKAAAPAAAPVTETTPERSTPIPPVEPLLRWLVPAAAVALVLLAVWAGGRMLRPRPHSTRPTAEPAASQTAPTLPAVQSSGAAQSAGSPVLHEEIPSVSRGARDSIRGQIKVVVRVTVDGAGNVVAENLDVRGSSKYFARLAADAAKKWKFAAAAGQAPREWLLQFEFSRAGVTGHAVPRDK